MDTELLKKDALNENVSTLYYLHILYIQFLIFYKSIQYICTFRGGILIHKLILNISNISAHIALCNVPPTCSIEIFRFILAVLIAGSKKKKHDKNHPSEVKKTTISEKKSTFFHYYSS